MAGVHVSGIRLIFLDVDGVLCCNKHGHLEADKLKRLAGIVPALSGAFYFLNTIKYRWLY